MHLPSPRTSSPQPQPYSGAPGTSPVVCGSAPQIAVSTFGRQPLATTPSPQPHAYSGTPGIGPAVMSSQPNTVAGTLGTQFPVKTPTPQPFRNSGTKSMQLPTSVGTVPSPSVVGRF